MHDEFEEDVLEVTARAAVVDVPMREQRSLATVTAEIRTIRAARDKMFLEASVEIGRRLKEAKELVGHGGWGDYCKKELDFSQQTAQNHIRLFEAYAAEQIRLDGAELKSQAFGNLTYTQALALLALPSEKEREAFVETHDVAAMSTRELQEELRKRGEYPAADAKAKAEDLDGRSPSLQKEKEDAEDKVKDLQNTMESLHRDTVILMEKKNEAEERAAEAEKKANAAAEELARTRKELERAQEAEADALNKLRAAEQKPKIPQETLDKLRKEAEKAAEKSHKAGQEDVEQAKAKLAQAEEEAARAKQEAEAAAKSLAAMQKELNLASPKVAVFRDRFASLQEDLGALITSIDELPEDKQAGARKGIRAILQNYLAMLEKTGDVQGDG